MMFYILRKIFKYFRFLQIAKINFFNAIARISSPFNCTWLLTAYLFFCHHLFQNSERKYNEHDITKYEIK